MENESYFMDINFSNERSISIFTNNVNYNIYNYRNLYYTSTPTRPCLSLLNIWHSLPRLTRDEIVLPAFIEQEFLIPDDAVCGITFEIPECCTPCGHYFCRAEITRWLKQQKKELKKMTCPTCRTGIT